MTNLNNSENYKYDNSKWAYINKSLDLEYCIS